MPRAIPTRSGPAAALSALLLGGDPRLAQAGALYLADVCAVLLAGRR